MGNIISKEKQYIEINSSDTDDENIEEKSKSFNECIIDQLCNLYPEYSKEYITMLFMDFMYKK